MSDVDYAVEGAVATITLVAAGPDEQPGHWPPRKHCWPRSASAAADAAVRCVVITGTGRAFCVGQDLREHIELISTKSMEEVWATVDAHYGPIASTIAAMPKPVIAAVNGVAAGAGHVDRARLRPARGRGCRPASTPPSPASRCRATPAPRGHCPD